jgi:hypothetical protein
LSKPIVPNVVTLSVMGSELDPLPPLDEHPAAMRAKDAAPATAAAILMRRECLTGHSFVRVSGVRLVRRESALISKA